MSNGHERPFKTDIVGMSLAVDFARFDGVRCGLSPVGLHVDVGRTLCIDNDAG